MINILVTGANGQLGSDLKNIHSNHLFNFGFQTNFVFTDIDTLDLSDDNSLKKYIQDHSFDYIINCAAYTNVDLAETEKNKVFEVNSNGVNNIVKAIQNQKTKFIHISTDYVFDGNSSIPYSEDIPTNPQSVYGSSKLQGEENALKHPYSIVIRTSWLYSTFGKNFAKTIYKFSQERESLNVVFDQIGTPTYAYDLAMALLEIISFTEKENTFKPGIYHYSNEGVCSWYDFAKAIAKKTLSKCKINPIESSEYPTPIKRPFYSVLNKNKIKNTFNIEIPHWQDSLDKFFNNLSNN